MSLPLAGSLAAAGFPSPADDYVEKSLDLNEYLIRHPAATFFVRVSGDSMAGAGVHHGDLLIVDRSLEAEAGRVVIAVVDGEMMVKRMRRVRGEPALFAEYEGEPPRRVCSKAEFSVWGVAAYVIHPL
ncbi:MAG: LexA family protein [Candidatus Hinthialibacter sp.]